MNIKIFAAALLLAACQSHTTPQTALSPDTLIAYYDPQTGDAPLLAAAQREHAEIVYRYRHINGLALRLPQGHDMEAVAARLRQTSGVLGVERNQIHPLPTR